MTVSVLTAEETWRWYDHHIGRQQPSTLGSVIFVNENENEMAKNEKETYPLTKAETDRINIENVNIRKRKQMQDENVIVSVP